MAKIEQYPWCGAVLCATALLASAVGFASEAHAGALTVGPVEQLSVKSSKIVVLGQTYHLSSSAKIGFITPGTLVVVDGTESASGAVRVTSVIPLSQLNVPGATKLLVTGVVSSVSNVGTVRIGKLNVDINATLTSDAQGASVGQLVQVLGTQPTAGGTFLAQATGIVGSGASTGIVGSGASTGIVGSGASTGIVGSGASTGIVGSGASTG
ncbi:MAG TPA: DUF5666 domain-containing protein, partial [Steroidobacteraceae bacterium]